jgi:hypothetical protein
VEESIAGPIREFDEAKSLLRTEPFYDATDRRTGGRFESSLAEAGSGAESTRLRLVVVIAELALPQLSGIVGVPKFSLMCELAHASHWDRPLVCVGDKPIGGNVGYTVPQWSASGDIKHPLRR